MPFEVEKATLEPKNVDERVLRLVEEHEVRFTFFLLSWILKKKIKMCINYITCIIYLCLIGDGREKRINFTAKLLTWKRNLMLDKH